MATGEIDLHKEEVRGLFVIGVMASLLAARDTAIGKFNWIPFGIEIGISSQMVNALLYYWGLYAFLMVIGISNDIFNERTARGSAYFAHNMLFVGIFIMIYWIFLGLLTGPISILIGSEWGQWVAPTVAAPILFYLVRRMRR